MFNELNKSFLLLLNDCPYRQYSHIILNTKLYSITYIYNYWFRIFSILLQKTRLRQAALYQAARLFELLPADPDELWQANVTYLHIPGHG